MNKEHTTETNAKSPIPKKKIPRQEMEGRHWAAYGSFSAADFGSQA